MYYEDEWTKLPSKQFTAESNYLPWISNYFNYFKLIYQ